MSTSLSIRHIAELAELELTAEEEKAFAHDVERIVAYFAELDAVDTSNAPPLSHLPGERGPLRPDVPHESFTQDIALEAAPQQADGCFVVPAFVE